MRVTAGRTEPGQRFLDKGRASYALHGVNSVVPRRELAILRALKPV